MTSVNIATLKEKLSQYLRMVEEGEEVMITSHKQPVAKIVPAPSAGEHPKAPSRPVSDLRHIKGISRRKLVSAVNELLKDRNRR